MFWQKPLTELTTAEWESICDGCGRCCLVQLEDEESGDRVFTDLVCRYSNLEDCSCSEYQDRQKYVPHCVKLSPDNLSDLEWMPRTCSYRVLFETKDLPTWHPLKTGSKKQMLEQGISVQGRVQSELIVQNDDDWFDHIIRWVD